jgi:hypothetical protein
MSQEDALTKELLSEALRVLLAVFNICLRPSLIQVRQALFFDTHQDIHFIWM